MIEIIIVGVGLNWSNSGAIEVHGISVVFGVVSSVCVLIIVDIDDVTDWDGEFLDGPEVAGDMTKDRSWVSRGKLRLLG